MEYLEELDKINTRLHEKQSIDELHEIVYTCATMRTSIMIEKAQKTIDYYQNKGANPCIKTELEKMSHTHIRLSELKKELLKADEKALSRTFKQSLTEDLVHPRNRTLKKMVIEKKFAGLLSLKRAISTLMT